MRSLFAFSFMLNDHPLKLKAVFMLHWTMDI